MRQLSSHNHRFSPPPRNVELVPRARFAAALQGHGVASMTVLCAPAGYGKACALEQVLLDGPRNGIPVGWLNIEEEDRSWIRLFASISCALDARGIELETVSSTDQSDLNIPIIILNDAEKLSGSEAESALVKWLLEQRPALHLVFSTRGRCPEAFAKLTIRGLIRKIDGSVLRMDRAEGAAMLQRTVAPSEWAAISARTWGWSLAIGAYRAPSSKSSVYSEQDLLDFVRSETIESIPADTLALLVKLSVADIIDNELAAEVAGPAAITQLQRSLQYLGVLTEVESAGLRLNPILREVLRAMFEDLPLNERADILNALAWRAARRGDIIEAIGLASRAEDVENAAQILNAVGPARLWSKSGFEHMTQSLHLIPADVRRRYPRIQLGEVVEMIKDGRISAAKRHFAQIRQATEDFNVDMSGGDAVALRFDASCVESLSILYDDIIKGSTLTRISLERRSISSIGLDELEVQLRMIEIVSCQQTGFFRKADHIYGLARKAYERVGSKFGEFYLNVYSGWSAYLADTTDAAIALYGRASEIAKDDLQTLCLSEIMVAEALFDQGQYAQAQALIDQHLPWLERSVAWFDFFVAAYRTSALLALRCHGRVQAIAELQRAQALADERRSACLSRLVPLLELEICLEDRNLASASDVVERHGLVERWKALPQDLRETSWRERDALLTGMARYYIATNDLNAASACLKRLREDVLTTERTRSRQIVDIVNSAILWRKGAKVRAAALLKAVVPEVLAAGRQQLLISHRQLLEPILEQLRQEGEPSWDAALWTGEVPSASKEEPGYLLSDRERNILRLAGSGDSNKSIARQLGLSENTVKYHLKRAASKMAGFGRGRIELAQRAKMDGLLM